MVCGENDMTYTSASFPSSCIYILVSKSKLNQRNFAYFFHSRLAVILFFFFGTNSPIKSHFLCMKERMARALLPPAELWNFSYFGCDSLITIPRKFRTLQNSYRKRKRFKFGTTNCSYSFTSYTNLNLDIRVNSESNKYKTPRVSVYCYKMIHFVDFAIMLARWRILSKFEKNKKKLNSIVIRSRFTFVREFCFELFVFVCFSLFFLFFFPRPEKPLPDYKIIREIVSLESTIIIIKPTTTDYMTTESDREKRYIEIMMKRAR